MWDILIWPEFGSPLWGTLTEDVECVSHMWVFFFWSDSVISWRLKPVWRLLPLVTLGVRSWQTNSGLRSSLRCWSGMSCSSSYLLAISTWHHVCEEHWTLKSKHSDPARLRSCKSRPSHLKDVQPRYFCFHALTLCRPAPHPTPLPQPVAACARFQRLNKDSSVFPDAQGRLQIAGRRGISGTRWKDASPARSARICRMPNRQHQQDVKTVVWSKECSN